MTDAEITKGIAFWRDEFDRANSEGNEERVWESFRTEGDLMHERDRRLRERNANS